MAVGTTKVVQVTNIAPQATKDQMQVLFGYLGKIEDIRLYPTIRDVSCPVQSRICYIKFVDPATVGIAQHMTNTVFIDRALIVIPVQNGEIPDEYYALEMTRNGTIVPGFNVNEPKLPPHVINSVQGSGTDQVIITTDQQLETNNLPNYPPLPATYDSVKVEETRRTIMLVNMDPSIPPDEIIDFLSSAGEVKYLRTCKSNVDDIDHVLVEFTEQSSILNALKMNGSEFRGKPIEIQHATQPISKPQAKSNEAAQKEIEEAMTRFKEAQNMINASIEPVIGMLTKDKRSSRRSRSRSRESRRRRHSRSRSRSRGSRSRRRRSSSRTRRSRSRDRKRRSRSKKRSRSRSKRRSGSRGSRTKRSRSRKRSRDRSRSRKSRVRSRDRDRKSRDRSKDRKRSKEREHKSREDSKNKEKPRESKDRKSESVDVEKKRSRSKSRSISHRRSRSRDRKKDRKRSRSRGSKKRTPSPRSSRKRSRSKSKDRKKDKKDKKEKRDRSRSKSRDKKHKDRSRAKSSEKSSERSRAKSRDKSREKSRAKSVEKSREKSRERSRSESKSKISKVYEEEGKSPKVEKERPAEDIDAQIEKDSGEKSDNMDISNSP